MNVPTKIIIHASATQDDPTFSWGAIRRWHIDHNRWIDIGYNAGCELVGNHYEVMNGRPWELDGAHCIGQNSQSLGFCLVGDFSNNPPPAGQLLASVQFLREWLRLYGIPRSEIYPHRHFNNTDCPGKAFNIEVLRALL
jgi:hypothetical protein